MTPEEFHAIKNRAEEFRAFVINQSEKGQARTRILLTRDDLLSLVFEVDRLQKVIEDLEEDAKDDEDFREKEVVFPTLSESIWELSKNITIETFKWLWIGFVAHVGWDFYFYFGG